MQDGNSQEQLHTSIPKEVVGNASSIVSAATTSQPQHALRHRTAAALSTSTAELSSTLCSAPSRPIAQHTVVHYHPAQPHSRTPSSLSPGHNVPHHHYAPPPGQTHLIHGPPAYTQQYNAPHQHAAYAQPTYAPAVNTGGAVQPPMYHQILQQPPPQYVTYVQLTQPHGHQPLPHPINPQHTASGSTEQASTFVAAEQTQQHSPHMVFVPLQTGSFYTANILHAPDQHSVISHPSASPASEDGPVPKEPDREQSTDVTHHRAQKLPSVAQNEARTQVQVADADPHSPKQQGSSSTSNQPGQRTAVNVQTIAVPAPTAMRPNTHPLSYNIHGLSTVIQPLVYDNIQMGYPSTHPAATLASPQTIKGNENLEGVNTLAAPVAVYTGHGVQRYTMQPEVPKRRRLQWTTELHTKFLEALDKIGVESAVPKALLQAMNVPGLTRENIASHLQKYRDSVKRRKAEKRSEAHCGSGGYQTSSDEPGRSFKDDTNRGGLEVAEGEKNRTDEEDSSKANGEIPSSSGLEKTSNRVVENPFLKKDAPVLAESSSLPRASQPDARMSIQRISLQATSDSVTDSQRKQSRSSHRSRRIWEEGD